LNDAAFQRVAPGNATQTLNFCQTWVRRAWRLVAVARNENIASRLRHRRIRDDEAIAVVVKNEASFYFIAIRERRGLGMPRRLLARFFGRTPSVRLRLGRRYRPPGNSSMAPAFS